VSGRDPPAWRRRRVARADRHRASCRREAAGFRAIRRPRNGNRRPRSRRRSRAADPVFRPL